MREMNMRIGIVTKSRHSALGMTVEQPGVRHVAAPLGSKDSVLHEQPGYDAKAMSGLHSPWLTPS